MVRETGLALVLVAACWGSAGAVDFLRADVNSDGVVSLADSHYLFLSEFRGGAAPPCESAANANQDSKVNIADSIWILNYLFRSGPAPGDPFPSVGPGPEWEGLACESYGGGSALDDPLAELTVLDATAAGGSDAEARITLAVSSSSPLAGYAGWLNVGDVAAEITSHVDLSGSLSDGFLVVNHVGERIQLGFLSTIQPGSEPGRIPAGLLQPVLELTICLRSGTKAGSYPLALEDAELVDAASGRSIRPRIEGGMLTVEEDLAGGGGCGDPACEISGDPAEPSQVDARFELGSASGYRSERVQMPFRIRSSARVGGYAFSIDFDEEALLAVSIEEVAPVGAGGFKVYEFNNRNDTPESAGVDEGFFVGAAVFSFTSPCASLPADVDNEVLRFHLEIRPEAEVGVSGVSFIDGAKGSGTPVKSSVTTAVGMQVMPETANSFVLVGAGVDVLPDLTAFVRGDSNGDLKVDISDPTATLGFLFLGARRVACYDAADANDDGVIDIADPIRTLQFLFQGDSAPPAPYPEVGEDPTPDGLGCRTRT